MAFWAACAVGAADIASSCLKAGALVVYNYSLPFLYDDGSDPVILAARRGYTEIVRLISSTPGVDYDVILAAACALDLADVITVVLRHVVDVNRKVGPGRISPLNIAARHGHVDAVKMLCVAGAKVSRTHLSLAVALTGIASQEQKLAVVLELLDRGASAKKLDLNPALLTTAVDSDCGIPILAALLDAGAPMHFYALFVACSSRKIKMDIFAFLLQRGCDAEQVKIAPPGVTFHGSTGHSDAASPLVIAAYHGNLPAVRALLVLGVAVNRACGYTRRTALHWAGERGHAEVVAALLAAGADEAAADHQGRTAWDLAGVAVRALLQRPPGTMKRLPVKLVADGSRVWDEMFTSP